MQILTQLIILLPLMLLELREWPSPWLRSYLTDYQFVDVNSDFSTHINVQIGVLQGFGLGPLLTLVKIIH